MQDKKRPRCEHPKLISKFNDVCNCCVIRDVLEHYCQGEPVCSCCGFKNPEALTMGTVIEKGWSPYAPIHGIEICFWLYDHGFPEGFRCLCFNCQIAIAEYGECPHERRRTEIQGT